MIANHQGHGADEAADDDGDEQGQQVISNLVTIPCQCQEVAHDSGCNQV